MRPGPLPAPAVTPCCSRRCCCQACSRLPGALSSPEPGGVCACLSHSRGLSSPLFPGLALLCPSVSKVTSSKIFPGPPGPPPPERHPQSQHRWARPGRAASRGRPVSSSAGGRRWCVALGGGRAFITPGGAVSRGQNYLGLHQGTGAVAHRVWPMTSVPLGTVRDANFQTSPQTG